MNVPKLRFKEFDGEWEYHQFSEIVNRVSKSSNSNILPKVEFEDIVAGEGRLKKNVANKFDDRKGTLFQPNNILYGKLRPYLKNWLFPKFQGVALGDFWVFEAVNSAPAFLYTLIQSENYQRAANDTAGTKMPRSDWKKVSTTKFAIPMNIKEQEKIGNFFEILDKKIQLQQQKIDLLQEQKKGYMQKIFNQEIRFKDGGHYYMKWAEYILNDLGETYTGLSGKTKEDFGVGEHSFVTYVNVFKNLFAKKFGVEKVIFKENENQNYVKTDDLFFTTSSETPKEVGMASIWKHESCNLHLNSFCFGYRVTNPKILPDFLAISLRSEYMRKKITILAQGSTRYNISKTEFMKEKVNVPCLEEQKRIVEFYLKLDTSIELEKKKLDILKEQKQGFMQQMFI